MSIFVFKIKKILVTPPIWRRFVIWKLPDKEVTKLFGGEYSSLFLCVIQYRIKPSSEGEHIDFLCCRFFLPYSTQRCVIFIFTQCAICQKSSYEFSLFI